MNNKQFSKLVKPYVIRRGSSFALKAVNPDDSGGPGLTHKRGDAALRAGIERLRTLQEKLYAQDQWGLLLIFQAMDAAGKDGAIEHVMSGVNPQGCEVFSFKQPSSEEIDHDFLWRTVQRLPERGRIGIFNRSYYEEVLIVRVHPEILAKQKLPAAATGRQIFAHRFEDINAHERYLSRNGYVIRKFFLHITKEEQTKRFQARLDDPNKHWKFSLGDLREQTRWNDYMGAYEDAIRHTATPHAPWIVVPANHKWFARLVVIAGVIDALEEIGLAFPRLTPEARKDLDEGRRLLALQTEDAARPRPRRGR